MLDQIAVDYAEALFNPRKRDIYKQEETALEAIRNSSKHNGMPHLPQYVTEVGKYLVNRTSELADAKRESLLAAAQKAKMPFDEKTLGAITDIVIDFCNRQQHVELGFLAHHTAQPWLTSVSSDLKAAVMSRIQDGISGVMENMKDKMNATRLETILDARSNQAVYASALGKQWDVFISHASEDKQAFVEPLANALQASGLNVWYDRTSLTVGDRLRQKIDEGLAQSRYGVVILSHAFFAKQWPKDELEGLFAREVNGAPGIKVVLPVWHSITAIEIARYSPMLSGRLAANSRDGIDIVVRKLREAMGLGLDSGTKTLYDSRQNAGSGSEFARVGATAPLDFHNQWKELASRFEKVPNYIGAGWQCQRKNNQTIYEAWDFSGADTAQTETLCRYAGKLLTKSTSVKQALSENVLQQPNLAWKWLTFLKEHVPSSFRQDGMPGRGEDGTLYFTGGIYKIGVVSATVCLDCAGAEL